MANIQKRGDSYRIRVSDCYDSNGKQIMASITWRPKVGMTEKQIEKELNRFVVEFENKVKNGDYIQEAKMRLEDFCSQYLEIVKDSLAPTTYNYYQRIIKKIVIPALGHMKLKDIKPIHVQMFVKNLANDDLCIVKRKTSDGKDGSAASEKYKRFAPSSVRRYYVVLQSILHTAYKLELISNNPGDGSKIDLPPMEPPKTEIFMKEEAAKMLGLLEKEPLMHQVLIYLAIVTGARRGEIVALTWDDIDFANGTVSINKSSYKVKGENIKVKQPKTAGSVRLLAIPPFLVDMLTDYKREQAFLQSKLGSQWAGENWLFTQWDGALMYPSTPTLWFSRFLERNGLPHKKFHALRHTSATLLLAGGINIKTVASRLGHTQLSTTNRYVHAVTVADVAAAKTFETMFTQEKNEKKED